MIGSLNLTKDTFKNNAYSGFFLDQQLACSSMCWTLYAQPMAEGTDKPVSAAGYTSILLRGIINDESPAVSFSVQHSYDAASQGLGADLLGKVSGFAHDVFESQKSTQIGYSALGTAVDGLFEEGSLAQKAINKVGEWANKGADIIDQKVLGGKLGHFTDKTKDLSRGSLMLGTDGLKYYSKSNVTIEIPQISFRYYHGMYRQGRKQVSVRELIQMLNNRFIGKFHGTDTGGSTIGVMSPPNGYFGSGVDIVGLNETKKIDGTFCLEYSGRRIPNLIVTNYQVRVSTQRVIDSTFGVEGGVLALDAKDKEVEKIVAAGGISSIPYDPLYADISITLEPVAIYTRENINQIMAI